MRVIMFYFYFYFYYLPEVVIAQAVLAESADHRVGQPLACKDLAILPLDDVA